jgi:hypothetical protein
MVLTAGPFLPPLSVCTTQDPAIAKWLCEDSQWPAIHTFFNFLSYLYFKDFKLCFLAAYVFESLEAIIETFAHSSILAANIEVLGDSLFSDIIMAAFGIMIGYLWTRIFAYPYRLLVPAWYGIEWKWLLYVGQILFMAGATLLYLYLPEYISGIVSITYLTFIVWFPGLYLVYAWWNRKHQHWKMTHVASETPGVVQITYKPVSKIKTKEYWRFHAWTAVLIFLYLASFTYRYTHVFLMALFHNTIVFIALLIPVIGDETDDDGYRTLKREKVDQ